MLPRWRLTSSRKNASSSAHQDSSRAASMYSPPASGGASPASRGSSPVGAGTSTRAPRSSMSPIPQTRATNSRAKSRKNPSAGGSGVETSTAPRWKSPAAVPWAKAPAIAAAGSGSSGGASGLSRIRSCPDGETASVSRRSIAGGYGASPAAEATGRDRRRTEVTSPRGCRAGGREAPIPRDEVVARSADPVKNGATAGRSPRIPNHHHHRARSAWRGVGMAAFRGKSRETPPVSHRVHRHARCW